MIIIIIIGARATCRAIATATTAATATRATIATAAYGRPRYFVANR